MREVSKTGGHLGPNLGVVELTIAMHRVFDSPHDAIVFDTGHQSYVHKLLTGRQDFSRLRQQGGLAGYPQRSGVGARHRRELARLELAVVGRRHLARLHDDRSERPTRRRGRRRRCAHRRHDVGGAQQHQRRQQPQPRHRRQRQRTLLRTDDRRHGALPQRPCARGAPTAACTRRVAQALRRSSAVRDGRSTAASAAGLHGFLSRFTNNEALYSNLDIKYLGPVHGHDIAALTEALEQAKDYGAPVIVHAITEKGRGYEPAVLDVADQFHAVGQIDPETGEPIEAASAPSLDERVRRRDRRPRRRRPEARRHHRGDAAAHRPAQVRRDAIPDRVLDVGIAEQHAVDLRRRPRVRRPAPRRRAVRHLRQPRLRPGAHGCRAAQGRRHLRARPRRRHRARRPEPPRHVGPRDPAGRARTSASPPRATPPVCARSSARPSPSTTRPTVLRFSKGSVGAEYDAVRRTDDGVDVLREAPQQDVLIVTVGPMAEHRARGRRAARRAGDRRDRRRPALGRARCRRASSSSPPSTASSSRIEDGVRVGGIGTRIRQDLRAAGVDTAVTELGLPDEFLDHGTRDRDPRARRPHPAGHRPRRRGQVLGSKIPVARPVSERHAARAMRRRLARVPSD